MFVTGDTIEAFLYGFPPCVVWWVLHFGHSVSLRDTLRVLSLCESEGNDNRSKVST